MLSFLKLESFGNIPQLLQISHNIVNSKKGDAVILSSWSKDVDCGKASCVFTTDNAVFSKFHQDGIASVLLNGIPPLDDGDIILYSEKDCKFTVLYSVKAKHNILFLTSVCNENCIMCPEPPRKDEIEYIQIAHEIINSIKTPPQSITITGGEPTIRTEDLITILKHISKDWAETSTMILTNGQLLSNEFVNKIKSANEKVSFGVPLYADCESIHDSIVGRKGSFSRTVSGLLELSKIKCFVEIRILLMQQNVRRLSKTISYISRNLPFVSRVVIMGLEPAGKARNCWQDIFIDPVECHKELSDCYRIAINNGIPICFYNFQRCTLPEVLRTSLELSISDWKQYYISECSNCIGKNACSGFFSSQNTTEFRSKGISPLKNVSK